MSQFHLKYRFTAKPWRYNGPNGWWFLSLPNELSLEIRSSFKDLEEGWGRLPATAVIGSVEWKTAIWFDSKQGTYLLPLKADVRSKIGEDWQNELDVEVRI